MEHSVHSVSKMGKIIVVRTLPNFHQLNAIHISLSSLPSLLCKKIPQLLKI